jgi:hypothetical protein
MKGQLRYFSTRTKRFEVRDLGKAAGRVFRAVEGLGTEW